MTVSLTVNENGEVIQDLLRVDWPVSPVPPAASEPTDGEMRAVVKFFNDIHGYSFDTTEDTAKVVFISSRVLNDYDFYSFIQGQKFLINVDDAGKGPQVQSMRLLNE